MGGPGGSMGGPGGSMGGPGGSVGGPGGGPGWTHLQPPSSPERQWAAGRARGTYCENKHVGRGQSTG